MKKILLLLCIIQLNTSFAWNSSGHQIIAAMAWDLLTEDQRNHWVDVLKHHPRFEQDFKKHKPADVTIDSNEYNEWIFRYAATWPDIVRDLPAKIKKKYHHGSWHYINYPIYLNEKVDTEFNNLTLHYDGKLSDSLNITQAIKGNLAVLSKKSANKKHKALALSWLLHIVGNAHQPLHSTALFSKQYFPKGDRGGNLIKIGGQGQIKNLHWYWDTRLDNSTSFKIIGLKAEKLNEKHSEIALKHQKDNIHKWIAQSHVLAKKSVYTPELLTTLKENEKHNKIQPVIKITSDYDQVARSAAEVQATKAAYNLAHLLSTH